ncbi:MAG: aspartate--ammonia ligase [Candidatus Heteroscillospira sp.]|jgi:aspartate--ammonia ligase
MNHVEIPAGYRTNMSRYETQKYIGLLKRLFEDTLSGALNLRRVSSPLFVDAANGLNDDLNGIERPVSFDIPAVGSQAQVVQSLAKWKRYALMRYGFPMGQGLYTDMNAIRRDEELDNLHSVYVDQWDWEKVIREEDRNLRYLRDTVDDIVGAICDVDRTLHQIVPALENLPRIEREVYFVTAQELEDQYPELTPDEREYAVVKEHRTVFIIGIGGPMKSGKKHDGRAPDYDDWDLNGDLLFWNTVLERPFEISSMGIRVSPQVLERQLEAAGCPERKNLMFHKLLLDGKLPYSIGGGIGQSRLCMLLMGKAHIGEVQASVWDEETLKACKAAGVRLL